MIEQQFLELILSHGFNPGQIIADGQYHRFSIKKSDKDGYYNLDPEGHGVFGNWKTGEQFLFRSGFAEKMTEQQRAETSAKYKAAQKKARAVKENAEAIAAIESNKLWESSEEAPATQPYLVKKQIQSHGTRVDAVGNLLVPIYDNKKIVNVQRILKNSKLFVLGAKKRGCYGLLDGQRDVIFIAEGFATAASINEATGRLCIIGLDAGNLTPVAKTIRKVYGVSQKIIIAADNDKWTEINGKPHNTGIIEAEKAATEIYAEVKFPVFADNLGKLKDWNDYYCTFGAEAVQKELLPVNNASTIVAPLNGHEVGVQSELSFQLDENGKPKGTIENLKYLSDEKKITLRYNVIKKQEEILIPNESYSIDNAQNAAYARMVSYCNDYDLPTGKIGEYLTYLCDQKQYNPVVQWILSKEWDGKSRIKEFYDTVQSPTNELKEIILQRWMVSAVASAFSPNGLSTRGVLVFQSGQYAGKTSWFKNLVPSELEVTVDGFILRLDDKDSIYQCLSHWLVELGELDATFKKSDIAQLKAFIPKANDILRRPYARKESCFGRRTVFFGSVNQKEFLSDETGNTRFWSIEVQSINYNHGLDMQQIWAEFYALYLDGEPYIMTPDEIALINRNNEDFMGPDYHDELVSRKFVWDDFSMLSGVWKTATEISQIIGVQNPKQQDLNRIAKAVKKYNGTQFKRDSAGNRLLMIPRERGIYDG